MLKTKSIAVVLLTSYPDWYPGKAKSIADTDKVRGDLALQAITKGVVMGYRVVVGDWISSAGFLKRINKFCKITIFKRKCADRGLGRHQAYLIASGFEGIRVILRTEPEKVSIIEEFIPKIISPIAKGEADIVVAKRSPPLFRSSYPKFMWKSETAGNKKYNNLLHKLGLLESDQNLDAFFGPIAFCNDPSILRLFLERYKFMFPLSIDASRYGAPAELSNSYLFPIVKALYQRIKVSSVEVDFRYPKSQKQNEESVDKDSVHKFISKRKGQHVGIIEDLIHFKKYLAGDPKNVLRRIE